MKKIENWRFLADLNISLKTISFLKSLGIDIKRVDKSVGDDEDIASLAKQENRTILTFDKDFGEIYYLYHKKTLTVLVLYLLNQTSENVNKVLKKFFDEVQFPEIKDKLILLYEYRYRIIS